MHKHNRLTSGFTIVELLIVIVVIAILAAISIVAYKGIQERARASEASAGLTQAKTKLELYKVDESTYPTTGNLAHADVRDSDVTYQYISDGTTDCLTATVGTTSYKASNTTSPERGGCAGHGQGGVVAVTNLAVNPRAAGTAAITSNNGATHPLAKNVTVPATPDGVTTAAEQRYSSGGNQTHVISIYNLDGLMNTSGSNRSVSLWVRVSAGGYRVKATSYFAEQNLPANTWVRVQMSSPVPGSSYSSIFVEKASGEPVALEDRGWVTGIMAVEGSQHYSFADGNSPNWIWNGTSNNSSSTGPSL